MRRAKVIDIEAIALKRVQREIEGLLIRRLEDAVSRRDWATAATAARELAMREAVDAEEEAAR